MAGAGLHILGAQVHGIVEVPVLQGWVLQPQREQCAPVELAPVRGREDRRAQLRRALRQTRGAARSARDLRSLKEAFPSVS